MVCLFTSKDSIPLYETKSFAFIFVRSPMISGFSRIRESRYFSMRIAKAVEKNMIDWLLVKISLT